MVLYRTEVWGEQSRLTALCDDMSKLEAFMNLSAMNATIPHSECPLA
jgi:hypothetical protein